VPGWELLGEAEHGHVVSLSLRQARNIPRNSCRAAGIVGECTINYDKVVQLLNSCRENPATSETNEAQSRCSS
jgi:hypothetical protein